MEFEDFSDISETRSDIFESRLSAAESHKHQGNTYFTSNDLESAEKSYHTGLFHINFDPLSYNFELLDKHREAVQQIKIPICLNLAAVRIKLKKYSTVVDLCNEVLKEQSNNPKALYRKAQALFGQNSLDSALEAVEKALKVADDSAVKILKNKVLKALRAENEKFKKMWKGKLIPKVKIFNFSKILSVFNPFNLQFRLFPLVF